MFFCNEIGGISFRKLLIYSVRKMCYG